MPTEIWLNRQHEGGAVSAVARRGTSVRLLLAAAAIVYAGCGRAVAPSPDPEVARTALMRALTAWKDGQDPDGLAKESPSFVIADHHWRGGFRLERFEIDPNDRQEGHNRAISVTLWERDARGKELRETVEYAVGTGSPITIHRADF